VEGDVDEVIAPGVETGDGVVEREGAEQQRAHHAVLGQGGRRGGSTKKRGTLARLRIVRLSSITCVSSKWKPTSSALA